jgi:eukaryotic-like serine/threonine-protein kinase
MSLQNRYKILQVLRRGGMATVYLALDQRLNCEVAVKEISFPEDVKESSKEQMLLAFQQEAKLLAGLNHPAFPKSRDYFIENDNHFFVMDFIGGIDLERLLQRNHGELGMDQIKDWTFQILDALEYLHGQKPTIIHRDIKPSNIKLNTKNQIRLLDFGIAKTFETGTKTDESVNFATLEYAPLEQSLKASNQIKNSLLAVDEQKTTDFLQIKSTPASDIFAFGATLYRLLTGQLPVDAHSRVLAIWLGKSDPLPSVSFFNPTVLPKLEAVIMQSLNLFPPLRPQSVADFRQQLLGTWKEKNHLNTFSKSFQVPNPHSQPHLSALIRSHQELLKKVRVLEQLKGGH